MKPYIITAVIAAIVVGGGFYYLENGGEVTYQKPQISATSTDLVIEEVEDKIPEEWEIEAQKAYDNVIRQNELAVMETEMVAEIRAEQAAHAESIAEQEAAHEASIDQKQAALDEVRKEQDSY